MNAFDQYIQLMGESLKLWKGYLDQSQEWDVRGEYQDPCKELLGFINGMDQAIEKMGVKPTKTNNASLLSRVEEEMLSLHKMIHPLKNESIHRQMRVFAELLNQLKFQ